jgi:uncharacterized protein YwlG (UPF0340 family)
MIKDALAQAKALEEAAKTLRQAWRHNEMLLQTGAFQHCEHCNQAIRIEHDDEELWEGFETEYAELEEAIGNGPSEWTCSSECLQARVKHHQT